MENNENKKVSKRPYVIAIVLALLLVVTITSVSYAYFAANITNTTTPTETVITTGKMEIEFSDGPEVKLENAIPGQSVTKTFSVKNTGDVDTIYDVYLSDLINEFVDKTDLVYQLTSSNGGYNVSSETQVPDTSSKIVTNQNLPVGATHNYTLKILFKETSDNQDDNKGKTFSTVIRINEVKDADVTSSSAVATIAKILDGEDTTSTNVVDKGTNEDGTTNTLAYDGTVDNNLRYVGANPANYVYFNCSTTNKNEMNDETCEKWRIIGVMNNIQTEEGTTENLVKIIRSESLGNYSWDTSTDSINTNYGINQWGESLYDDESIYEGADLMRELNYDYLGNIQVGTDGYWYYSSNNKKTAAMPTALLNVSSQSMIETVLWNLGSPSNNNGSYDLDFENNLTPSISYTRERADTNGKVCIGGNCNDKVIRTSTWTGKIALMYPSDYGYATTGGSTTNKSDCLSTSMYNWNGTDISDCKSNDWLLNLSYNNWTISPFAQKNNNFYVLEVAKNGRVYNTNAYNSYGVTPALFLKSTVNITGGDGSSTSPYTLG